MHCAELLCIALCACVCMLDDLSRVCVLRTKRLGEGLGVEESVSTW